MRYLLLLLWLILGLAYFLLARYCGKEIEPKVDDTISPTIAASVPCPSIDAFSFNWSSDKIHLTEKWSSYKESLLQQMKETSKIRITGLYNNKEINSSSFENLGEARADAISKLIGLEEEKYQLAFDSLRKVKYSTDCPVQGVKIRLVTVSEKIKEIEDRTLIYFPVNSINKLADAEVESYLDEVALRVIRTGEIVKLDGHADNSGDAEYNFELGQRRAEIIKQYLITKKVKAEKIQTNSFGDEVPISSNDTEEGRAENRRTELRIINENQER